MTGYLVLEDGTVFEGHYLGNPKWITAGEVVFNTSLTGYQEILTDPSYFGQIVVLTTPEIGNYGVSGDEGESEKIWAQGLVCVNINRNFKKRNDLAMEMERFSRPVLTGVDTRALAIKLRTQGTPWGVVLTAVSEVGAQGLAKEIIKERRSKMDPDWVHQVSTTSTAVHRGANSRGRVAVLDFGMKKNILVELKKRFNEVVVLNSRTTEKQILDLAPDGLMLTNGPGDPENVDGAALVVKSLLGKLPIWGICMGHQVLALALGGKTFKLKFGHRGGNHPVRDLSTGSVLMSSHNHGYSVSPDLPRGVKISQINLYDKTVEGIQAEALRAWSVQYHPEACPGPHDSIGEFDVFQKTVLN